MNKGKKLGYAVISVALWLLLWQLLAERIHNAVFLPSPWQTAESLGRLAASGELSGTIAGSLFNITKGFFLAAAAGSLLAVLSAASALLCSFFDLPVRVIKATPVASFTILALLWMNSSELSVLISFFMALPVIYTNVLTGIRETDRKLLEMARVFEIPRLRRVRYLYLPSVLPFFLSACSVAIGLAWKSGIAAEVIGVVKNSIGNRLYQSKIYLEIPELFAWTLVTILVSVLFEQVVLWLVRCAKRLLIGTEKETERAVTEEPWEPRQDSGGRMEPEAKTKSAPRGVPAISVNRMEKKYGDHVVLQKVSLLLQEGEHAAVMGSSGIGKTTLLRILLGIEQEDGGSVTVNGTVAVVFQENRLCEETTVLQNLRMICRTGEQRARIPEVLSALGLADCRNRRAACLSGGMKRRVAIARALLADGSILLLDEPFRGLDERTRLAVMEYTRSCAENKTLLLITHDRQEAEFFGCRQAELFPTVTAPETKSFQNFH